MARQLVKSDIEGTVFEPGYEGLLTSKQVRQIRSMCRRYLWFRVLWGYHQSASRFSNQNIRLIAMLGGDKVTNRKLVRGEIKVDRTDRLWEEMLAGH